MRSSAALIAVFAIAASAAASAPESGEGARELADRIREARKGVADAEVQKRKTLGSLYGINVRMKKITKEKGKLTNELMQTQHNVKSIAKVIAGLEVNIDHQRKQLRRRLRALYKLSGESYVGILFSRASIYDLDETLRYLKIVSDNDHLLIRNFQRNIASHKAQRQKLKGQVEKLVGLERDVKKQEEMLAAEHRAKSKAVTGLDQARVEQVNKIRFLREQTQALGVNVVESVNWTEVLRASIYEHKGQLPSPVKGTIVQDFGLVTDEKYKIRLSHKGWRIAATAGTKVAAVFDGKVLFADWVEGYGQTVVLDHGDHYYSVYSHITHVKAKTGDTLKKGQPFAAVGAAVNGYGDGIYFEIRHFSEPENPGNWIAKKEAQTAGVSRL